MKALKPMFMLVVVVIVVIILLPAMLVLPFSNDTTFGKLTENIEQKATNEQSKEKMKEPAVEVAVLRTTSKQVQKLPLESYLIGVVAAEMPVHFEKEALKAQSLTARTYIVNQLIQGDRTGLPANADVSDGENHQVYKSDQELKELWGSQYKQNLQKIKEAVQETAGQILTYEGDPITATFFSTSNGYTENSEEYWKAAYPYLKSVSSPWDTESPKFYNKVVMTVADFEQKLGVNVPSGTEIGTVVERTAGKRVGVVRINGKELTGKQIREKLHLMSSDFSWERQGNQIIITTKGYGHGVGMSQYGANGMAQEGKSYKDIVKYYYKGVTVQSSNKWVNTLTVKK
ncbi:stage II sporulation protein D [Peribacillus asahii]|uniref:stage II sporulation protein D n=1 Tax=Peribacillus asahii TaxID=228899 RepID=UPI00207958F3|nr:stage II sporulation protein D [Peribacillus asahii]USK84975.1 stage II sporulation protein D [Peribacillus asahii]